MNNEQEKFRWAIYLISNGNRTYVGSTTDVNRRLRQHNGELTGGARSTRGYKWELICYVSGFENRSVACRWEKLVKSRAVGLGNRTTAMALVHAGVCPRKGTRKQYQVPSRLTIHYNLQILERTI